MGALFVENSRNKYLIKNTFIFTIGNLGSKLINFFLVPIYTYVLTTAQYGTVDLVSTVCTVTIPIFTLNICESVMRFALDKNADKEQIIRIGSTVLLIGSIIALLIVPFCGFFSQLDRYKFYIYFYSITLAASQLYLCDLRGKELLIQYACGNILYTFLVAVFNIIFLVKCKGGIEGYLLAYILANTITAIYALICGKGYKLPFVFYFDKKLFLRMTKYSIVLIPNSFMWWIMNSSDRVMLSSMIGVAANGIFAVSYKLPTLVTTTTSIFNQAWSYSAIKENGARDEGEYNNQILFKMTGLVMFIGIGMMTFIKPFLSVYVSKEYYCAWKYTPFLIIGCVYLTLATFIGTSYTVHKDSFGYLFSGLFGAVVNLGLNYVLIQKIGMYGAAFSTGASYILVFIYRLIHTRKYIVYRINNFPFIVGSVLLILSAFLIYWDTFTGFTIQLVLLVIYTLSIWKIFSLWITSALKKITNYLRK